MKFIINLYIFIFLGSFLGFTQTTSTYHVVAKGENVYRISLKYKVSMDAIFELNPGSDKGIEVGQSLKIPGGVATSPSSQSNPPVKTPVSKVETKAPSNTKPVNSGGYINYTIKPQETLYGLSKKAGMTIPEFLKLNPQLSENVLIGTIIKMPNTGGMDSSENEDEIVVLVPKQNISTQVIWNTELESTGNQSAFVSNYKIGMQMAIDSIKQIIPNLPLEMSNSLDLNSLKNIDSTNLNSKFIIQPLVIENDSTNYLSISTLENEIPVSINYSGITEESEMRNGIIRYLGEHNGNKILIYDKDKNDTKDFVESQITNLKTIRLNNKGVFTNQDLIDHLVTNTKNYVIIESSRDGVFLSATNTLLKELSKYDIELVVLDPKYIPEDNKVSSKRFHILKLIYPSCFSPTFYDQEKQLLKNYSKNVSQTVRNEITYGFGMVYNALYQIYFNDYNNLKEYRFINFGIAMEYDNTNLLFNNKTVYIYRFEEDSNTFLLETYKSSKL